MTANILRAIYHWVTNLNTSVSLVTLKSSNRALHSGLIHKHDIKWLAMYSLVILLII
jgi:hypothetical protein